MLNNTDPLPDHEIDLNVLEAGDYSLYTLNVEDEESKMLGEIIHKLATFSPISETLEAILKYYNMKNKNE